MISWTPITADDYFEFEFMDLAYQYQQYLKELLLKLLGQHIKLLGQHIELFPVLTNNIRTIPFPELINNIEKNIDLLFGDWTISQRKASVEWLGGLLDTRLLDYTDVNRWFEMMELIERLIISYSKRQLITGVFRSGSNRTRQTLRREHIEIKEIIPDLRELHTNSFSTGNVRIRQIIRKG